MLNAAVGEKDVANVDAFVSGVNLEGPANGAFEDDVIALAVVGRVAVVVQWDSSGADVAISSEDCLRVELIGVHANKIRKGEIISEMIEARGWFSFILLTDKCVGGLPQLIGHSGVVRPAERAAVGGGKQFAPTAFNARRGPRVEVSMIVGPNTVGGPDQLKIVDAGGAGVLMGARKVVDTKGEKDCQHDYDENKFGHGESGGVRGNGPGARENCQVNRAWRPCFHP